MKDIVLIGGGGHCKSAIDVIEQENRFKIVGIVDRSELLGTNILGYSYSPVDNEVIKVAKIGNMSTLNCPEEVYLSEQILKQHPWASMSKFTRGGGEANAVAIRIARSNTKKKNMCLFSSVP